MILFRPMETRDWYACWLDCSYLAVDKSLKVLKTVYQATRSCLQNMCGHSEVLKSCWTHFNVHFPPRLSSCTTHKVPQMPIGWGAESLLFTPICNMQCGDSNNLITCCGLIDISCVPKRRGRGFLAHANTIWLMPPFDWKKGWGKNMC